MQAIYRINDQNMDIPVPWGIIKKIRCGGNRMKKIIIDCDPGHDDAVALLLATRSKELDILGVSVVAGNSSLRNTLQNARDILAFADASDIPVYAGCERPLKRDLMNQSGRKIHGENGLGGKLLEVDAPAAQEKHAVDFLVDTLCTTHEKITLVCLGPLTNIAQAFLRKPRCMAGIDRLVIMGGAVRAPGNINSAAEFNFYIDPEAAKIVVESGCRITLIPLDVTMKAMFFEEEINELKTSSNRLAALVGELLGFYAGTYEEELGFYACPVHDALCIAVFADPSLVAYEQAAVKVSIEGITAGESVADLYRTWPEKPGVEFGTEIDRERFVELVKESLVLPRGCKKHE